LASLAPGARPEASRRAGKSTQEASEASEALAKTALDMGDHSLKALLRVLRAMQVPATGNRKNVMPDGVGAIHGMLLGLYYYAGTSGLAAATTKQPFLTKLLIQVMLKKAPDFPFTSVQLNYGYASRPHVDKNNLGTGYIIGLGDYTDGELWVHDEAGDVPHRLDCKEDVTGYYRVGRTLPGTELQIKNTWTIFDGNKLHFTKPFRGERYSIIFFTSDRYRSTQPDARKALGRAGFDFDFDADDLHRASLEKHVRRAELQRGVAREFREIESQRILLRGRCIGRTWAHCWGVRCTAACEENSDFCGSHLLMVKGKARWQTHGRMDGKLPKAKYDEMLMWQKTDLKKGNYPPCIEGATILVDLTEDQIAAIQEQETAASVLSVKAGA